MVIISAIDKYRVENIKPLVESLNRVEFKGTKVMITYDVEQEVIDYLKRNGWKIESRELKTIVHLQRFLDSSDILSKYKENEPTISIDAKDVIFNSNPEEYSINSDLYIGLDGKGNHFEHSWGSENFLKSFPDYYHLVKNQPHLNVGVLYGVNTYLAELCKDIFNTSLESKQRDPNVPFKFRPDDQMAVNLLAYTKYKDKISIQKESDRFVINLAQTPWDGSQYVIYHQYDRLENFNIKKFA